MSLERSDSFLRIELKPPRVLVALSLLVLIGAIAVALTLPTTETLRWGAAAILALVGGFAIGRWTAKRPRAIALTGDGRVLLLHKGADKESARLAGPPRVLATWLTVPLDRRTQAGKALLVTPDMTDRVSYRRLGRWLRTMTGV